MEIGIAAAQPWARLGDVGAAIQEHAEKNGYSVVRDLCGHGVGIKFHEEPDVEHFGRRGTGMLILPGMTFTIEPMINMGTYESLSTLLMTGQSAQTTDCRLHNGKI